MSDDSDKKNKEVKEFVLEEGPIPFDKRKYNVPYPVRADGDHWYADDTVGYYYDGMLLSICGNSKFWNSRYQILRSHHRDNTGVIKCTRFKEAAESNNVNQLKAVCNVAYLMKREGPDAGRVPDNILQGEEDGYWSDVGRWCSVDGNGLNKPNEGGKKEKESKD